jgi:hypothetical protein
MLDTFFFYGADNLVVDDFCRETCTAKPTGSY